MSSSKILAPGSLVLVTGANGYVGGHVADLLLSLGYKVRGTVRDQAKLDIVTKAFAKYPGQFEGVVIADMSSYDAFAQIVKGTDGVVHVASDTSFGYDPNVVVTKTVNAINNALTASDEEHTVKRFVYTSSNIAAVETLPNGTPVGVVVNDKSWNDADVERAWAPEPYTPDRALAVYAASKVEAEKAAWKFAQEKKPHFELNTILPAFVLGPKAFAGQNLSTSGWVQGLYDGKADDIQRMQYFPPISAVDARDIARLHVAALLETDVVNQRILAAADSVNYAGFVEALKQADPSRTEYPAGQEGQGSDKNQYDVALADKLLQRYGRTGHTRLVESLRDQIAAAR